MKWEYKTCRVHDGGMGKSESYLKDLFDRLGEDGWELVQMVGPSDPSDFGHRLAIFKRPGPRSKVKRLIR